MILQTLLRNIKFKNNCCNFQTFETFRSQNLSRSSSENIMHLYLYIYIKIEKLLNFN